MQYFIFILKSSIDDFRRNKIRTFLTSLGILIGVASVVLLMAFGLGLKRYIGQQFESLGTNLLFIMPGNITSSSGFAAAGGVGGISFDQKDVATVKRVKNSGIVMPMYVKFAKTQHGGNSATYEMIASTADVFTGLNFEAQYGSVFSKADNDQGRKVVFLGFKSAEKLFGDAASAVDGMVKIEDQSFKVIGVARSKGGGGIGGASMDEHIFIPLKTASLIFNPTKKYYAIYAKALPSADLNTVKDDIRKALLKRYKPDDFSVAEQKEILSTVESIFTILNSVLIAIATISLVVGGIGIMNIMYVSVIERIREIGIRRAIGATRNDILSQFLTEAIILSLLGGFLGLGLSFVVVLLIQPIFPAYIDLNSILIAVGVSSAIGITFGFFPARKAANLSPIEAIRYE